MEDFQAFIKKCTEIFESRNSKKIDAKKLDTYENLLGFKICPEFIYVLENYEGVMLKEGYGFVPEHPSPLTDENGYETFIEFIGLNTKYNLFTTYEMYKDQLPIGIFPIAEMDGGNYLCMSNNNEVYTWLHDCVEGKDLFLASPSIGFSCLPWSALLSSFCNASISKTMAESYYQDHQGTRDKASNTTN